jgi:hypothetical protein
VLFWYLCFLLLTVIYCDPFCNILYTYSYTMLYASLSQKSQSTNDGQVGLACTDSQWLVSLRNLQTSDYFNSYIISPLMLYFPIIQAMSVVRLQFEYRISLPCYSSSRSSVHFQLLFQNWALDVEKGTMHKLKPSPFQPFQYTVSATASGSAKQRVTRREPQPGETR